MSGTGLVRNDVTRNPYVWGALGLCATMLVVATYVPGIARVLKVTAPSGAGWLVVLGMSLLPCVVGQVVLSVRGLSGRRRGQPPARQ